MSKKHQHYALDISGKIVHINDVQKAIMHFSCPHCKSEMIARQGRKREWHFAHKSLTNNCNYETYLHTLAKIKLHDWFCNTKHIFIKFKVPHRCKTHDQCKWYNDLSCLWEDYVQFDLKSFYNLYEIEKTYQSFRADICLSNQQSHYQPIFIEICVNHACDEKKLNSGIRIIELIIKSEEDIEKILCKNELEESDTIRFYNFKHKLVLANIIKEPKVLRKFIIYNSGKSFCTDTDCQTFTQRRQTAVFELTVDYINSFEEDSLYIFGGLIANKSQVQFKSCNLCKYHKLSDPLNCDLIDDKKIIFCCLYRKLQTEKFQRPQAAQSCLGFKLLESSRLKEIKTKYQNSIIDIWTK